MNVRTVDGSEMKNFTGRFALASMAARRAGDGSLHNTTSVVPSSATATAQWRRTTASSRTPLISSAITMPLVSTAGTPVAAEMAIATSVRPAP